MALLTAVNEEHINNVTFITVLSKVAVRKVFTSIVVVSNSRGIEIGF
jgi:hypothetical protein